jgi:heme-degrading monooxygenase HmoA
MANILVHIKVEDYNKWKPVFDGHASFRSEMGSKSGKVLHISDNPNDIFILFEWDSIENAKKFSQSDNLKEAMKNSGVISMPEIYFLEEYFSVKA